MCKHGCGATVSDWRGAGVTAGSEHSGCDVDGCEGLLFGISMMFATVTGSATVGVTKR